MKTKKCKYCGGLTRCWPECGKPTESINHKAITILRRNWKLSLIEYPDSLIEQVSVESMEEYATQQVAEALDNHEKWISVEERLPETNCDVLVVKKNGRVFQMSYHAPFDSCKRVFQWWGFGRWIDQNSQITYWQPLPQPPIQR